MWVNSVGSLALSYNTEANQRMNYNHLLIVILEADEIQSTCLHGSEGKLLLLLCTLKDLS